MNILLNGISGFMGQEVVKLCQKNYRGATLAYGVDTRGGDDVYTSLSELPEGGVDCIIDFSHHSATPELLEYATERTIPLVLCTTGHTTEEIFLIHNAAKSIPLFYSGNMSVGIALLIELAKTAAAAFPEANIEIVEKHHIRKLDAPSGTALMLADALRTVRPESYPHCGRSGAGKRTEDEIGIHSIRMGNIVGEHEVMFAGEDEVITISHSATSKRVFATGAIRAAKFLPQKVAGMYEMKHLLAEENN